MSEILAAEVDLPCADVQETARWFGAELGFRLLTIFPADDPSVAVISGFGLRLRLVRALAGDPGRIRLLGEPSQPSKIAPNGTVVQFAPLDPWPEVPDNRPSLYLSSPPAEHDWHGGRAGMQYRDLIPDRWGGRFIASHIRIPTGGPVPDYTHFHKVRFQMIYCVAGWVRLVYEDQGPPFVMKAGDCVLQPPTIRHRVLECSDGLEVVEIGCPADHPTHPDPDCALPSREVNPDRDFHGQRYVFHRSDEAVWRDGSTPGHETRDLGIAAATGGLADVRVVRRTGAASVPTVASGEFHFLFVLTGATWMNFGTGPIEMTAGASAAVPPGTAWHIESEDVVEYLEVTL